MLHNGPCLSLSLSLSLLHTHTHTHTQHTLLNILYPCLLLYSFCKHGLLDAERNLYLDLIHSCIDFRILGRLQARCHGCLV